MGERIPASDADQMETSQMQGLPPATREVLEPLLKQVESLTEKIQPVNASWSRSPGNNTRKPNFCGRPADQNLISAAPH